MRGQDPYYDDFYQNRTKEESYRLYYEEILSLLKNFSDFDVLGHLDYIKRYGPYSYEADDIYLSFNIIEDILRLLIEKGKGLEVNTSGYKHISTSPMPSEVVLSRYKELGGQRITIGTDSHNLDYMGYGLKHDLELIKKAGFKHISIFKRRKEKLVDI